MPKSLNTKLVLFDLDGTLIDTAPDFVISLNNILKKYGRDVLDFDRIRSFVSEGSAKFTEIGFEITQGDPNFQTYRNEFLQEYKNNLINKSEVFDGIDSVINYLKDSDIAFGIVTNKPYDYALPLVSYFKELSDSKVLICPDHLKESKPSPEGILLACKKIGVSPGHTVYVGDHPNDLIAGKRAGTKTIGCLYGYSLSKDKNYKDSVIVKEASQIIDALKSI
ncbi:HAD-IA family hydrolase [Gammaproteobacteria bacterium]|nr:HAD-IA family hydrolase [Gammaproteobacteria bacterium]